MKVQDIEIPLQKQKNFRYRLFEILPGALSWSILILPFILSQINAQLTALLILAFILLWFARALGLNIRVIQGWKRLKTYEKMHWQHYLDDLQNLEVTLTKPPKWHTNNLERLKQNPSPVKPRDLYHAIVIAAYNESQDVLEPTIQSVLDMDYDMKKVILVFAYEGRDGAQSEKPVLSLTEKYKKKFYHAIAVKHPLTPNEVRGKGGNITYAARELQRYLEKEKIDPLEVVVTTLDSDNRPHRNYLALLSYMYASTDVPEQYSFQPVPIYSNNIWDAPAPMRVIATGNSFWNVVLSMRPHMIRNFSSHAQGMKALIETDFWSVRTIVEDGHQFWRTYFRYDGNHYVLPMYIPIFQDAVLDVNYRKTLRMQFVQLRRWAWGASDVAYVADKGFFTRNKKLSKVDVTFKFLRLLEGHISWATAPLILALAAFIPLLINPDDFTANQLPQIVSRIQTVAMAGILITLYLSVKALPPKPKRYKAHRNVFMILQWVLLPVTSIVYSSFSALNSQTRLMFGWYLGAFDVTTKHVKSDDS
ncbi:MAG: glycosyltransferase family 2 protein [Candidatus Saccharimonadales bacterium]